MAKRQTQPTPAPGHNVHFSGVGLTAFGFVAFGATFYHLVEKLTWIDSFYFTTMTLATVGYGDISPKTDAGKIFTIFYVLVGISIFVVSARIVLRSLFRRNNTQPPRR